VSVTAEWIVAPFDRERAASFGRDIGLSPVAAQLLLNRGIADAAVAKSYLEPKLAELRRPDEMAGFAQAVSRLERAVTCGETVGVFGDYDVDGVTSCALLTTFLRGAGGKVVPRAARRDAGYGFSADDVRGFAAAGCAVIVTCDLGTSDHEALAEARARGIDAIVVDHHQVPDKQPDATLINPHQASCRFPFKGLASVGVAFYLAAALRTRLRERGWTQLTDPRTLLDLVAVGTVADMAPLTGENRILVHAGLRLLREAPRPGLRALAAISGLDEGVRRAADIGLRLSPRLNAPGRLGAAQLALDLLLADDTNAEDLARQCDDKNIERQSVQEKVVEQAFAQAETQLRNGWSFLVCDGEGWPPGVVGIVAGRLMERLGRPAAVIAFDGAQGRGSLRTVPGVDLHAALKRCSDLLVRFGGHPAAAGLTVERRHLSALAERLCAIAREQLGDGPPRRSLHLDAVLELHEIDQPLAAELRRLEPYGVGNPEPLFGTRGVLLEHSRVVGKGHLQITLRDGPHARDGIAFNLGDREKHTGGKVRAAYFPEIDTFRGVERLRVRLRDLEPEASDA
jgi:single-stranded-DNA-specific exonuclease